MKIVVEHYHQEYVYQFLMGLNESFAAIRGQILLMEPLPSVNKVFSMITQEEKQQEICVKTQAFNLDSVALMTTPVNQFVKQPYRKDKQICTHYGVPGHTADKCYRLHGFPPRFKFTKNLKKPSSSHSANNVQDIDPQPQQHDPLQTVPQLTITPAQCQQLLSLLQQQSFVQQPFANMVGSITTTSFAPASISSSVTGSISHFFYLNPKHLVFLQFLFQNFQLLIQNPLPGLLIQGQLII